MTQTLSAMCRNGLCPSRCSGLWGCKPAAAQKHAAPTPRRATCARRCAQACLSEEPDERPSFEQVQTLLLDVRAEVGSGRYVDSKGDVRVRAPVAIVASVATVPPLQSHRSRSRDRPSTRPCLAPIAPFFPRSHASTLEFHAHRRPGVASAGITAISAHHAAYQASFLAAGAIICDYLLRGVCAACSRAL